MVFWALVRVLRGVAGCGVPAYASPSTPCAALTRTKNPHFWIGHIVYSRQSFGECYTDLTIEDIPSGKRR